MIEKILAYILACCNNSEFDQTTVALISENLKISRSQVSVVLNKLVKENKLIRIESKPFCFISVEYLKEKSIPFKNSVYASLDELLSKQEKKDFEKLVGMNHSLAQTVKQCKATISYPPNGLPMLLYGPTGTGKSLIAKLTYEWAKNQGVISKDGQFVQVNCSEYANNPELLTANLFGHVKGAFTGAISDRNGYFAEANGGTIFLDEIGELPPHIQSKLLQLIQEKTIERVSGTKRIELDFRLLVATNRNLEEEVQRGLFRSDLFYRLNVIRVHIPPLRQRPEDILPMAHQFLERFCKEYGKQLALSPRFVAFLEQYPWPGNVRQLENLMERLVITAQNPILDITALPLEYNSGGSAPDLPSQEGTLAERMDAFEGQIIRDSYRRCGTTVAVAKELGISQATAVRKIAKYVKDRKE